MSKFLSNILLVAIVGLGAAATTIPTASAAGIPAAPAAAAGSSIEAVGYRNGFQLAFNEPRRHWDRRDRRGRCNLRLAEAKARDSGLRRARVVDVSPRRVVVDGRKFGDRVRIVFANVRGCPTIRR